MKDEYSPYKVIHHNKDLETLKRGGQIVPKQLQLIISDMCNLSCSFCAYRNVDYTSAQNFGELRQDGTLNMNPNRIIPYDKCKEIIDDYKALGGEAVQVTGGGEPTMHPQHLEIFRYIVDLELELAIVTNGVKISDDVANIMSMASWVRFSIDAGSVESYRDVKGADVFNNVINNIHKVVAAKKKNNTDVILGVGFVVDKTNYSEIYDCAKLAKSVGVDNFRVSAAFMPNDAKYHQPHYEIAKRSASMAKEIETDKFTVFNLFDDRVQDLVDKSPDYSFCGYMHFNTYIGGDLKVYSCCNNAYNDVGEMGDLSDKTFKEFWVSKEKEQMYKNFDARLCERCMFNEKNRFIAYCIKDNPRHINFV
jgi:MoaA/NifB/PqqE/SkfB family radical SAM enzyme